MGYWGTNLYDNDTTLDIRDSFKEYLMNHMNIKRFY